MDNFRFSFAQRDYESHCLPHKAFLCIAITDYSLIIILFVCICMHLYSTECLSLRLHVLNCSGLDGHLLNGYGVQMIGCSVLGCVEFMNKTLCKFQLVPGDVFRMQRI